MTDTAGVDVDVDVDVGVVVDGNGDVDGDEWTLTDQNIFVSMATMASSR